MALVGSSVQHLKHAARMSGSQYKWRFNVDWCINMCKNLHLG